MDQKTTKKPFMVFCGCRLISVKFGRFFGRYQLKVTFPNFFSRFPNKQKFPERHSSWTQNCRISNPHPRAVLCSAHFTEECLDRTGQIVRLRDGAIPTIFWFYKTPRVRMSRTFVSFNVSKRSKPCGCTVAQW